MTTESPDVVLIGAGNVGYHLGRRLAQQGIPLKQVFSRSSRNAGRLSEAVSAPFTTAIAEIIPDASLYILAVRDDAISEVAEKLAAVIPPGKLVVHTSGATPTSILAPFFERRGVFYPLQTFSLHREVDFEQIPICLETTQLTDMEILQAIAERISSRVHQIDDEQRADLHVAAVFVNNFANYLFGVGAGILQKKDLSFDLLRPLILETAGKVQDQVPADMQTGPASRGDLQTIERHLACLEKFPSFRELYRLLTVHINPKLEKSLKK